MKLPALVLVSAFFFSACSTVTDRDQGAARAAMGSQAAEASWIERNGPSAVPRDGWVETVSGWYRSREACLQHRGDDAVGTPLALDEECLELSR